MPVPLEIEAPFPEDFTDALEFSTIKNLNKI